MSPARRRFNLLILFAIAGYFSYRWWVDSRPVVDYVAPQPPALTEIVFADNTRRGFREIAAHGLPVFLVFAVEDCEYVAEGIRLIRNRLLFHERQDIPIVIVDMNGQGVRDIASATHGHANIAHVNGQGDVETAREFFRYYRAIDVAAGDFAFLENGKLRRFRNWKAGKDTRSMKRFLGAIDEKVLGAAQWR